jgi:hypothetical protein
LEGDEQFHAPQPGRQNDFRKTVSFKLKLVLTLF